MPVARIFSESASDAAPLVSHLHALGYTIEIASPASDAESHADLEIRLGRCSRVDALAEAERRARDLGSDIYIASGALRVARPESAIIPEPDAIADKAAPEEHTRTAAEAEPIAIGDPLAPVVAAMPRDPETSPVYAAEVPPFVSAAPLNRAEHVETSPEVSAVENSSLAREAALDTDTAHAERGTTGAFTFFGQQLSAEEASTNAETLAAASSVRWEEVLVKPVNALRDSVRQLSGKITGVFAASAQHAVRKLRSTGGARRQRTSEIPVAAFNVRPTPAPPQAEVASPPPSERSAVPRAGYTARPLPWTAFASAGAIAVAALLSWSVLTGRSATPNVPINGNIEQQIPFGPVKIVPRSLPSQLPAVTTKPAAAPDHEIARPHAPTPISTSKPTAIAKPKKATRHVARTRHHHREQIAEDDVVVHHYTLPKPPTQAKVSSTSIKHISDQN